MTAAIETRRSVPGDEILNPVFALGLGLLLFNDHLLRVHHPCWLSGKLSDFGVVLFFPFLASAFWSLGNWGASHLFGHRWTTLSTFQTRPDTVRWTVCVLFAGLWLAAINLFEPCRDFYLALLHRADLFGFWRGFAYVMDPTDCIALLLIPVVWLAGHPRRSKTLFSMKGWTL